MAEKIYLSQIQAKIDRLKREQKQVLAHLVLIDDKIEKLNAAIDVMKEEALSNADAYNTELYTYRTFKRRFKGKLRQMLLVIMKAEPNRYFTVNELVELALIKDGQPPEIHPQHTVSVRGALKFWLDKGAVERLAASVTDVKWRLKQK